MKSQISFTTDIFESKNGKTFGKDLAEWMIDACAADEFSFGEPFQDDWGWTVLAEAEGEKFVVGCAIMDRSIGDEQADWLITVEKERRWMFGSKDSILRSHLCDLIQNVLRNKPHIREIRWTNEVGHFAR